MHDRVIRKWRREPARLAGVGAHRLHPDAEDVPVVRQQPRCVSVEADDIRIVGTCYDNAVENKLIF